MDSPNVSKEIIGREGSFEVVARFTAGHAVSIDIANGVVNAVDSAVGVIPVVAPSKGLIWRLAAVVTWGGSQVAECLVAEREHNATSFGAVFVVAKYSEKRGGTISHFTLGIYCSCDYQVLGGLLDAGASTTARATRDDVFKSCGDSATACTITNREHLSIAAYNVLHNQLVERFANAFFGLDSHPLLSATSGSGPDYSEVARAGCGAGLILPSRIRFESIISK